MIELRKLKIADLNKMPKTQLRDIYKNLIEKAEGINLLNSNNERELKDSIGKHREAMDVFVNLITAFHNKYYLESDISQKEILRGYIENLQIYLTKLQNQYNQTVYSKQQCEFKKTMRYAYIAIAATIIFSLITIIQSCSCNN